MRRRTKGLHILVDVLVVVGGILLLPQPASASDWKQFGANTHPNPNGVVVVRCVDEASIRAAENNRVSYRYTMQSRDQPCGTGAQKTETVDCSRLAMYQHPAQIPGLGDIMGPIAEAAEYVCAHRRGSVPAAAQTGNSDCSRYIAALDRCIRIAQNEKIRNNFTALRGAAVDLVKRGGPLAATTCKADLPEMEKCLGLASREAPSPKQSRTNVSPPPSRLESLSISGKWIWRAQCEYGRTFTGQFFLTHQSNGNISGACHSADITCGAVTGHVDGRHANLSVWWSDPLGGHTTPIGLAINDGGKTMRGVESSVSMGSCQYQVRR
jgi:hypothetical protein